MARWTEDFTFDFAPGGRLCGGKRREGWLVERNGEMVVVVEGRGRGGGRGEWDGLEVNRIGINGG